MNLVYFKCSGFPAFQDFWKKCDWVGMEMDTCSDTVFVGQAAHLEHKGSP